MGNCVTSIEDTWKLSVLLNLSNFNNLKLIVCFSINSLLIVMPTKLLYSEKTNNYENDVLNILGNAIPTLFNK